MNFLKKIFKPKSERDFKKLYPIIEQVNKFVHQFEDFREEQFLEKTREFKERLKNGETTDGLLPEAFALVKAGCKVLVGRTWDVVGIPVTWEMVPYDVQIAGAVVLHEGNIAEMATGEGKTAHKTADKPVRITAKDDLGKVTVVWMPMHLT